MGWAKSLPLSASQFSLLYFYGTWKIFLFSSKYLLLVFSGLSNALFPPSSFSHKDGGSTHILCLPVVCLPLHVFRGVEISCLGFWENVVHEIFGFAIYLLSLFSSSCLRRSKDSVATLEPVSQHPPIFHYNMIITTASIEIK